MVGVEIDWCVFNQVCRGWCVGFFGVVFECCWYWIVVLGQIMLAEVLLLVLVVIVVVFSGVLLCDEMEWIVVDVWQVQFGIVCIYVDQDFFEFGGYLLLVVWILVVLEECIGVCLIIVDLFGVFMVVGLVNWLLLVQVDGVDDVLLVCLLVEIEGVFELFVG